jgi:hypothetical protein
MKKNIKSIKINKVNDTTFNITFIAPTLVAYGEVKELAYTATVEIVKGGVDNKYSFYKMTELSTSNKKFTENEMINMHKDYKMAIKLTSALTKKIGEEVYSWNK